MPYSIDSSSDHCYPGTSCLMNKFDIHDAQKLDELESSIVYGKLALLQHISFCFVISMTGQARSETLTCSRKAQPLFLHLILNDAQMLCSAGCKRFVRRIFRAER